MKNVANRSGAGRVAGLAVALTPVCLAGMAGAGLAGSASLFPGAAFTGVGARPLASPVALERAVEAGAASLFAGAEARGLFAPLPDRPAPATAPVPPPADNSRLARLRALIARAEAGPQGYDAVQHGARSKPAKPPTQMTVGEIFDWIERTPGQPHAIGRYQVIPSTLRWLVNQLGIGADEVFSPALQDRLADALLDSAGWRGFAGGRIGRRDFMLNLAKIWAGLPTASGQSYYHGYAGNSATMSWAEFDAAMAALFPG